MMAEGSWEHAAQGKKASIKALIPVEWRLKSTEIPSVNSLRDVSQFIRRYLTPHELEITELAAEKTLKKLSGGEWTAVEVTRAFCHRAAIAHQLVRLQPEPPS
jgi:amidase